MLSRTALVAANLKATQRCLPQVVKRYSSDDAPIEIPNPYEREKKVCILCKHDITPSYKNVRLLAQFQSSFTGKIFGPHITGLCMKKQAEVENAAHIAHSVGMMPAQNKELEYMEDTKLFNPERPFRPHPH